MIVHRILSRYIEVITPKKPEISSVIREVRDRNRSHAIMVIRSE